MRPSRYRTARGLLLLATSLSASCGGVERLPLADGGPRRDAGSTDGATNDASSDAGHDAGSTDAGAAVDASAQAPVVGSTVRVFDLTAGLGQPQPTIGTLVLPTAYSVYLTLVPQGGSGGVAHLSQRGVIAHGTYVVSGNDVTVTIPASEPRFPANGSNAADCSQPFVVFDTLTLSGRGPDGTGYATLLVGSGTGTTVVDLGAAGGTVSTVFSYAGVASTLAPTALGLVGLHPLDPVCFFVEQPIRAATGTLVDVGSSVTVRTFGPAAGATAPYARFKATGTVLRWGTDYAITLDDATSLIGLGTQGLGVFVEAARPQFTQTNFDATPMARFDGSAPWVAPADPLGVPAIEGTHAQRLDAGARMTVTLSAAAATQIALRVRYLHHGSQTLPTLTVTFFDGSQQATVALAPPASPTWLGDPGTGQDEASAVVTQVATIPAWARTATNYTAIQNPGVNNCGVVPSPTPDVILESLALQ